MTTTISQLKSRNRAAGYHFFEPATMRFFDSRIERNVWTVGNGHAFITSEQFGANTPRLYTARFMEYSGDVNEFAGSKFQQFSSKAAAMSFIVETIKAGK